MASKLPHPSSPRDLPSFKERVRLSPPSSAIDHNWLVEHLGFSQRSNAGTLLSFLEATQLVENGKLTDRGELLLGPNDSQYQQGMRDAIDDLLGKERADSIRAGSISREALPSSLQRSFKVGKAVVQKFFPGLRWLATEANDEPILAACPGGRVNPNSPRQTAARGSSSTRSPSRKKQEPSEGADSDSTETRTKGVARKSSNGTAALQASNPLLSGDLLQVRIDGTWEIQKINKTLRWLQMIALGEPILPESNQEDAREL